ncbi:ROK family protein [Nonomuraea sp. NPDC050790]|uniref:ROK family protein n=1 Tax=Nonomuraea sp. NPDC050790 TaxID=3364371 RepID=UPI0037A3FF26
MPQPIVVLDVGGTHLRWATWSRARGLGPVRRAATPSLANGDPGPAGRLRERLVAAMARVVPERSTAGVSFGAALNHRSGAVYASAPLWGACTTPFDLLGALSAARPDVRWHVVNDVTAALLHLADGLAGQDRRKVLLVTVSTGIACRILDRRSGAIPTDDHGLQGEIGHLPASVSIAGQRVDLRCDCGEMNHVSSFSSGPGIRRLAEAVQRRDPGRVAFEDSLVKALDAGDRTAGEILRAATLPVAEVVRTALCLDPELDLVAFTGGVTHALGAHYRRELLGHLTARGLYLTSTLSPGWIADRLMVCPAGQVDCLVGAGLAAETARAASGTASR